MQQPIGQQQVQQQGQPQPLVEQPQNPVNNPVAVQAQEGVQTGHVAILDPQAQVQVQAPVEQPITAIQPQSQPNATPKVEENFPPAYVCVEVACFVIAISLRCKLCIFACS